MPVFKSVDGSGTITTGGTAQNLFGGNIPVNGYRVVNPDASNDLWINENGTALANGQGSMRIAANGGWYETVTDVCPVNAISIVGTATGQKFTAQRW